MSTPTGMVAATAAQADTLRSELANFLFSTAYATPQGRRPASLVVHAATEPLPGVWYEPHAEGVAVRLLNGGGGNGALFVAGHLHHQMSAAAITTHVILRCVRFKYFHLRGGSATPRTACGRRRRTPI